MKIERWNGNSLRRYHLKSGAIIVVNGRGADKKTRFIPAWSRHVSVPVTNAEAVTFLKGMRT